MLYYTAVLCVCVIQPYFPQLTQLAKVCHRLALFSRITWIFAFLTGHLKSKRNNEFTKEAKKFNRNFSARVFVMYELCYVLFMYKRFSIEKLKGFCAIF